jgi:hypothetical protein
MVDPDSENEIQREWVEGEGVEVMVGNEFVGGESGMTEG